MQFKASTDYGLRAVLYLAAQGHTCSSKDIAQDMSIPRDYLIQLAQLLRNAGIIEARPGKHGGYRLANDPSKITLLQVVNALDDDAKDTTRTRRKDRADASMVQGISGRAPHRREPAPARRSCCRGVSDRTADGLPHSIADQRRRPQVGAFFLRRCARSSIRCWLALRGETYAFAFFDASTRTSTSTAITMSTTPSASEIQGFFVKPAMM